jgi:hypothetical protein
MKKQRREQQEASISFLDVISCGFGAIVLLLVIAKVGDPSALEDAEKKLLGSVKSYQERLFEIRGESVILDQRLQSRKQQLSELSERVARLKEKLASVAKQSDQLSQSQVREKEQLQLILQVLTEEMKRLNGPEVQKKNLVVGGIPVDSEYIIFVIDTSGSMQTSAWGKLQIEMINILNVYPGVKGIQVLSDRGDYMFKESDKRWIPDSPETRAKITTRLKTWAPTSFSNPAQGIETALEDFYKKGLLISIYTLGDDFQGDSLRRVVEKVDRLNMPNRGGDRLVRIHAIGFPVQFRKGTSPSMAAIRFAAAMRELSYNNDGTFIGLNSLE